MQYNESYTLMDVCKYDTIIKGEIQGVPQDWIHIAIGVPWHEI